MRQRRGLSCIYICVCTYSSDCHQQERARVEPGSDLGRQQEHQPRNACVRDAWLARRFERCSDDTWLARTVRKLDLGTRQEAERKQQQAIGDALYSSSINPIRWISACRVERERESECTEVEANDAAVVGPSIRRCQWKKAAQEELEQAREQERRTNEALHRLVMDGWMDRWMERERGQQANDMRLSNFNECRQLNNPTDTTRTMHVSIERGTRRVYETMRSSVVHGISSSIKNKSSFGSTESTVSAAERMSASMKMRFFTRSGAW